MWKAERHVWQAEGLVLKAEGQVWQVEGQVWQVEGQVWQVEGQRFLSAKRTLVCKIFVDPLALSSAQNTLSLGANLPKFIHSCMGPLGYILVTITKKKVLEIPGFCGASYVGL